MGFTTTDPSGLGPVDFAGLAQALGCTGFRAGSSLDSVIECLERARACNGPAVVDVKVAFGRDQHAALGAFGRWNVGPWSQRRRRCGKASRPGHRR